MIRPNLQNDFQTPNCAPVQLSEKLDKNLSAYAAAATAAGMGMMMSALPADAKIVYTPSNKIITQNGGLIPLDLNHDGTPDFEFSNFSYQTHGLGEIFLRVQPAQPNNEIWDIKSQGHLCAAALPFGKPVGPKGRFQQDPANGLYMAFIGLGGTTNSGSAFGPWRKVETAYLGLKFMVKGETHFGWARIEFASNGFFESARIEGYAYETIADKPIEAGHTKGPVTTDFTTIGAALETAPTPAGGLGLLARGVGTLEVWRRKEQTL